MKDWQIRREIFYRLNTSFEDDVGDKIELDEDVVGNAIAYFIRGDMGWIYPAKSYAVAICYARWMHEEFGESFMEMLDSPDLLAGNDPYFKPYSADPATYDAVIAAVGLEFPMTGLVPYVRRYFEEEFLLNEPV